MLSRNICIQRLWASRLCCILGIIEYGLINMINSWESMDQLVDLFFFNFMDLRFTQRFFLLQIAEIFRLDKNILYKSHIGFIHSLFLARSKVYENHWRIAHVRCKNFNETNNSWASSNSVITQKKWKVKRKKERTKSTGKI